MPRFAPVAALAFAAALELAPAAAHEPYGAYLTPFGQPCCGEDDCAPLADGDVSRVRGGYFDPTAGASSCPRSMTGPDNRYHICTFQGLRMRFLIPPGPGA